MSQINNNNISTIKTKIGNFLLEYKNGVIYKFFPTKLQINLNYTITRKIEVYINNYLSGANQEFSFKLDPKGSNYQKKVWKEIQKINYGETLSYQEIASSISSSPRAVGNACAKNPCLLFIPCHRVVKKNNHIGNYLMGSKIKQKLLQLERKKVGIQLL